MICYDKLSIIMYDKLSIITPCFCIVNMIRWCWEYAEPEQQSLGFSPTVKAMEGYGAISPKYRKCFCPMINDTNIIAIIASALTGFSVSMLWPGTLIIVGENYPNATVAVYALMAVAGDMGGAVAPYFVGKLVNVLQITDNPLFFEGPIEQTSMRGGLFFATTFPILGLFCIFVLRKHLKKRA